VVPADTASAAMHAWVRRLGKPGPLQFAAYKTLRWWAARGDSTALAEIVKASREVERVSPSAADREAAGCGQAEAEAHLALLRADTAEAVRRFSSLLDLPCGREGLAGARLVLAQLLATRADDRPALRLLRQWSRPAGPLKVFWRLEEARASERVGDRDQAAAGYRFVAAAWRHGDPETQPYVTEAREALQRLSGEPQTVR